MGDWYYYAIRKQFQIYGFSIVWELSWFAGTEVVDQRIFRFWRIQFDSQVIFAMTFPFSINIHKGCTRIPVVICRHREY